MFEFLAVYSIACIVGTFWYRRYSQRAAIRAYAAYYSWIRKELNKNAIA